MAMEIVIAQEMIYLIKQMLQSIVVYIWMWLSKVRSFTKILYRL